MIPLQDQTPHQHEDLTIQVFWESDLPRGSRYSANMELGPKRPSLSGFEGPNSIMVLYMEPLGYNGPSYASTGS